MMKHSTYKKNVAYLQQAKDDIKALIWLLNGLDLTAVTLTNRPQQKALDGLKTRLEAELKTLDDIIKGIGGRQ